MSREPQQGDVVAIKRVLLGPATSRGNVVTRANQDPSPPQLIYRSLAEDVAPWTSRELRQALDELVVACGEGHMEHGGYNCHHDGFEWDEPIGETEIDCLVCQQVIDIICEEFE